MKKQLNQGEAASFDIIKEFVEITKSIEDLQQRYALDENLDSSIDHLRTSKEEVADKLESIRLSSQEAISRMIVSNTYAIYSLLKG